MMNGEKREVLSFDDDLSYRENMALMFERTDEDGILYISGWHYDSPDNTDEDNSYRCRMTWSLRDYETVVEEFEVLYRACETIAAKYDRLDGTVETAKAVLGGGTVYETWERYIRPFCGNDIDRRVVADIEDRMEIAQWVKELSLLFASGEPLSDTEKAALRDYLDVTVSEEEKQTVAQYREAIFKEAEKRVGETLCAYDVVVRAMRLCRLMSLEAPSAVIRKEARECSAAFVLHRFAVSRERVDNTRRREIERLECMSDEELDEYYRPKKTNSRKSMAPLFVYLILKEHSNNRRHLRQQDILKLLESYPYEVTIERKALSRVIHNLIDSQLSIYSDPTGTWFEQA